MATLEMKIIGTIIALGMMIVAIEGRNKGELRNKYGMSMPIDKKWSRLISYVLIIGALIFITYIWIS